MSRRQSRRLVELEQRFEHVVTVLDVNTDALRKSLEAREVDRMQIEKLMRSNMDLRGDFAAIRAEMFFMKRDIAIAFESLKGMVDNND